MNPLVIAINKNVYDEIRYKGIKVFFGSFKEDWGTGNGWYAKINDKEYGNWLSIKHSHYFDLKDNAKETIDKLL